MSDLTERLDVIQARLHAATPGPWRWDENYGDANDTGLALTNDARAEIIGAYNHHCCAFRDDPTVEDADAEFIAAAPSDVAFLLDLARKQGAALERVESACDRVITNADGHKPPGPPHPTREQATASRIRASLEAKP